MNIISNDNYDLILESNESKICENNNFNNIQEEPKLLKSKKLNLYQNNFIQNYSNKTYNYLNINYINIE